jgi:hypothetical protein
MHPDPNDGNANAFTNETFVQGLDQLRMEGEEKIDGNQVKGLTVLNGDKGWRKNGDDFRELDGDRLANRKRNLCTFWSSQSRSFPTLCANLRDVNA